MNLNDLPDWVWQLLVDLDYYEDVHPPLYRLTGGAAYEPADCPVKALDRVPVEVREVASLLSSKGVFVPCSFFDSEASS